jgi:hypothetical protein
MVMRDTRLEVPYEEPDEEGALERFGNLLKKTFVRDPNKYPTTGRSVDFSGMPSRGPMRDMAMRSKNTGREQSRMGSDKNVNVGSGRGTTPYSPATPAPKMPTKRATKPSVARKPAGEYVAPSSPEIIAQTTNVPSFPGTPGGAAVERGNVTSQGTTRNYEAEFPVEMFNPSSMTMAAPMREGLFGEQISQEDYDAMTQRNKDAGFYSRFKKGGSVKKKPAKKMAKGGSVSSASKRGDGCCQRGKTKGRMV